MSKTMKSKAELIKKMRESAKNAELKFLSNFGKYVWQNFNLETNQMKDLSEFRNKYSEVVSLLGEPKAKEKKGI